MPPPTGDSEPLPPRRQRLVAQQHTQQRDRQNQQREPGLVHVPEARDSRHRKAPHPRRRRPTRVRRRTRPATQGWRALRRRAPRTSSTALCAPRARRDRRATRARGMRRHRAAATWRRKRPRGQRRTAPDGLRAAAIAEQAFDPTRGNRLAVAHQEREGALDRVTVSGDDPIGHDVAAVTQLRHRHDDRCAAAMGHAAAIKPIPVAVEHTHRAAARPRRFR